MFFAAVLSVSEVQTVVLSGMSYWPFIDIGACGAILQKADDDFFVFIHLVNRSIELDYEIMITPIL